MFELVSELPTQERDSVHFQSVGIGRMFATRTTWISLPSLQRRMVEAWLARFEEGWGDQSFAECLRALPPNSSVRRPLVWAMIERDLERQWANGRELLLDDYLRDYPEVSQLGDPPIELVAAEFEIRHRYGKADLEEYAVRYPKLIDDLRVRLAPLLEGSSAAINEEPAAATFVSEQPPLVGLASTNESSSDSVVERRLKLLLAPSSLNSTVDCLAVSKTESRPTNRADNDLEMELPPELYRTEAIETSKEPDPSTTGFNEEFLPEVATTGPTRDNAPSSAAPCVPSMLGRYRIQRSFRRDGQGSTYEANDIELDRRVVLKVPFLQGGATRSQRERFQQEARIAASLYHPLWCPILDIGQDGGIDYLVMPYVEGDSLADMMNARPVWPARAAVDLFYKLATAIDAAHQRGIIHRDLKPSNIIFSFGEIPTIVGIGQSQPRTDNLDRDTAVYLAPEWCHNEADPASPRIDIYSLGAMLYQLLTGQRPPHPLDIPTLLSFPPDLDPPLQAICRRALSRNSELRHTSMREFAQELARYRESLRPSSTGTRLTPSQLHRLSPSHVPATTADKGESTISHARSATGVARGSVGGATSQVQQIRQISTQEAAPVRMTSASSARRRVVWEWVAASSFSIVVLMGTLVLRDRHSGEHASSEPDSTSGTVTSGQPAAPASAKDRVLRLAQADRLERPALSKELKECRDPELAAALVDYLVSAPWMTTRPHGEDREAVLAVLLSVDPLIVPDVLKRAAKSEQAAVRRWTYLEIGRRIDLDSRARLLPVLLAGLKDPDGSVRQVVAEQIRQLPPPHEPTIAQALFDRVADALWGDPGSDCPDGGKNAALEALEEFAPQRVVAALNQAERGNHPDVRRWAILQKSRRTP